MCGIAGIYRPGGLNARDRAALPAMLARIFHRGPDEEGQFLADTVAMGCRRLSIIDISGGQQPMFAADGRVAAVANAEIYNHVDLRSALHAKGARFRSRCDVEVLPHLYLHEGPGLAARLNGQFAFAIYDSAHDRLVLGRDQTGIAPLFWAQIGDTVLFGSEIKAILAHPDMLRRLDPAGLDQVLTFPGLVAPRTMFDGVKAVKPGHVLVIERGNIREERYWDYDFPPACDDMPTEAEANRLVDALDEALSGAVARRLVADVPVGLYVSGGLDSALIAAMTQAQAPETARHSFSITFPGREIDESRWQSIVTERIGSRHHAVAFDEDAILDNLRRMVVAGECALKESYNACTLALAERVAQQDMRVVLTGEGADELFGGYVGYRLDGTRGGVDHDDLEALIEDETRSALWGDAGLFYERDYAAHAEMIGALYSDALQARRSEFAAIARAPVDVTQLAGRSAFHQRSYLDLKLRLPDHLLADHSDRVAYAASVEARYPFLDPAVIDVARQIPPALMVQDGEEKALLKRLARRYLPAELVDRRKFSFVAPGSPHLLRKNQDWVMDLLSPETVQRRGVFNPDTVARLRAQYEAPNFDLSQTYEDDHLMIVLTTEILLDAFDMTC